VVYFLNRATVIADQCGLFTHASVSIFRLLGRHRSTINRENIAMASQLPNRATPQQGPRALPRQRQPVQTWAWPEVTLYLSLEWGPKPVANKLPIGHEMVNQHAFSQQGQWGTLETAVGRAVFAVNAHDTGR
jgi:hypothetical protein